MDRTEELTPDRRPSDNDRALRPQGLDEFIGQADARANLRVFIESAKMRGEAMDHTLFHGPPGLGKTTLAQIMARELGVTIGDTIKLISPNGTRTAFGTSPRVSAYEVVYIFTAGRWDIDRTRVYLPMAQAQLFFNKDGVADEIEVMVENPEAVDDLLAPILIAAGDRALIWTWRDSAGAFLRALTVEDNVMFVLMAILVLIASMNIISGLIMLVKNKGRDIGILRTMGLTEGSVLRVFFICGASIGTVGTIAGVILGCLFAIYIDPIFSLINYVSGGGVWDPSIRGIYHLPAELRLSNVVSAVALSLGLSWTITLLPARRAARMNPVEALRYE